MTERFIDDYLPYLLARASNLVSAQFHGRLKSLGISVAQWRVLGGLSYSEGVSIGELAAVALFQQPTMTKIIDRMERDGLVMRRPATDDRRRVLVALTERGEALAGDLRAKAELHQNEVLDLCAEGEAQALRQALRTLIDRLAHTRDH